MIPEECYREKACKTVASAGESCAVSKAVRCRVELRAKVRPFEKE